MDAEMEFSCEVMDPAYIVCQQQGVSSNDQKL